MAAFSPEPTDSGFELANWLFGRLVVLVGLTEFVAIGIQFGIPFGSIWGIAAGIVVNLVGFWIAIQLVFESVVVLVETSLEDETGEVNP
ncbi:hypothetical protein [Natrinema versiforme]|uniref:Uncharacterized protein n=1 Tax=Natrinema versiforme JCM 10478 TaxID=1227496 RepID=L9XSB2_9EURY|nr:hypothetical protein [Natrinema versiforme]ELY64689.1 hypothetical protein C489_16520 [Natrinema versiforme JCM 10478]